MNSESSSATYRCFARHLRSAFYVGQLSIVYRIINECAASASLRLKEPEAEYANDSASTESGI